MSIQPIHPRSFPPAVHTMITAVIIVLGAILRKSSPEAGFWVTLVGLGWYLLFNIRPAAIQANRFRSLAARDKAHVVIVAVILFLFIRALRIDPPFSYFMMIALLAVDYLLLQDQKTEE